MAKKEMDNLAKDAAAALAANMSYGKWKAMQYKPVVIKEPETDELPVGWKICPACSKRFEPTKKKQIYCCMECRKAFRRESDREYQKAYRERKRAEKRKGSGDIDSENIPKPNPDA